MRERTASASAAPGTRWRCRFSLRRLLLSCILLSIALGLTGNVLIRLRRYRTVEGRLRALQATLSYRIGQQGYSLRPGGPASEIDLRELLLFKDPLEWIHAVHFHPSSLASDDDLALLPRLPHLISVQLHGAQITDEGLAHLAAVPSLRHLALCETNVTSQGLAQMAANAHLVDLLLVGGSDDLLQPLRTFEHLRRLRLRKASLTSRGLAYVASVRGLRSLDVRHDGAVRVGDEGLAHLASLAQLRGLALVRCRITDEGLLHLRNLKQLRWLDLAGTRVNGAGLRHLVKIPDLEHLRLDDTPTGDEGLRLLARLPAVYALALSNTEVTDAGLRHLAGMSQLQSLSLVGTRVTDQGLRPLCRLKQLFYLALGPDVTVAGAESLKRHIPACQIEVWDSTGQQVACLTGASPPWPGMRVGRSRGRVH